MSAYFTGVTFAKQKVTPADDAIVRKSALTDGALTGCGVSYSGSTLTMTAGHLIICGRQIRHTAAQNWKVADATSGFARLVLTIDLTLAATKDTFEQVTASIEYASSVNGFPELEQADINASGSQYQFAACVVSLGASGITGIVTPLPKSKAGGDSLSTAGGAMTGPLTVRELYMVEGVTYGDKWPADGLDHGRLFFIAADSAAAAELGV